MSNPSLKDIFTRATAGRVYPAAWGAAHIAKSAGKEKLAEELTTLARQFRSIGRYGEESHIINAHPSEPIKAADVPEQFAALARELSRTDAWGAGDVTLIGFLPRSDGGGRRLWAKAHGKSGVRYSAEPDVLPKAERDAAAKKAKEVAVIKERARLAARKLERENGPDSPVKSAIVKKAPAKAPAKKAPAKKAPTKA